MACRGSAVRVRLAPFFISIGTTGIEASISKVLNLLSNKFSAKVSAFRLMNLHKKIKNALLTSLAKDSFNEIDHLNNALRLLSK